MRVLKSALMALVTGLWAHAALAAEASPAPSYALVDVTNNAIAYVDRASIQPITGGWISFTWLVLERDRASPVAYSVQAWQMNCETQEAAPVASDDYAPDGSRLGMRVSSAPPKAVAPQTLGFSVLEFACGRRKARAQVPVGMGPKIIYANVLASGLLYNSGVR